MNNLCRATAETNAYHDKQDEVYAEHQAQIDAAEKDQQDLNDTRIEKAGDFILASILTGSDATETMSLVDELTTALAEHLCPDGRLMNNLLHLYYTTRHGLSNGRDESDTIETICTELNDVIGAVVESGEYDNLLISQGGYGDE